MFVSKARWYFPFKYGDHKVKVKVADVGVSVGKLKFKGCKK